ncbi:hypothetical protein BCR33DRAFT_492983 [Rhizoclosmatium globosum]|uniref:Uncharacterized protein n=1 Tax=Rhizoclosmatium globosum TaxID=329046 RepID=A0A1Y2CUN5_9FUNG|nr:hypothetical protein BCR33DRAFT_492983 [Rhizoclosmatium globosum]|eukprot:ORY50722.1 hypothetical protein BCR33DRAFT_492983 [Rhizoclosmatium globosum]
MEFDLATTPEMEAIVINVESNLNKTHERRQSNASEHESHDTVVSPRLVLGDHVQTCVICSGNNQWSLCDSGAQLTIIDQIWAAANGIKKATRMAMTVKGYIRTPGISQPSRSGMPLSRPISFESMPDKSILFLTNPTLTAEETQAREL